MRCSSLNTLQPIIKQLKNRIMERLIGMTDFVLDQMNKVMLDGTGTVCAIIGNYANFLKQPLTLGFFVPCDEEGNVLTEPNRWDDYLLAPESFDGNQEWYEFNAYEEVKERVLFDGFEVNMNGHSILNIQKEEVDEEFISIDYYKKHNIFDSKGFELKTIEDLVELNLTLTKTAKKQIGL